MRPLGDSALARAPDDAVPSVMTSIVSAPAALERAERETDGPVFWRAQAAGWGLFGLVYFLVLLPQSPGPPLALLAFKIVWAATGVGVSSFLWKMYRAVGLIDRPTGVAATLAVPLSAVLAGAWVLSLGAAADRLSGTPHLLFTASSFPFVALNHFLMLLAWSGIYLTLGYRRRSEVEARRALAATALARTAQLEMLRYQLNPHFLFNALNTVRALALEDPSRARDMVGRLSEFLRYALDERRAALVPVREEIRIVRDYLAIEKVRFEERLEATVTLDESVADREIPVFLLHTLVENAIKHGAPREGRLEVDVRVTCEGDRLRLEVSNTGRLAERPGSAPGLGLGNARQRLEGIYPGRASLHLEEKAGRVHAIVLAGSLNAEAAGA
jgi:two-component system, LytTR family, sensor kinase